MCIASAHRVALHRDIERESSSIRIVGAHFLPCRTWWRCTHTDQSATSVIAQHTLINATRIIAVARYLCTTRIRHTCLHLRTSKFDAKIAGSSTYIGIRRCELKNVNLAAKACTRARIFLLMEHPLLSQLSFMRSATWVNQRESKIGQCKSLRTTFAPIAGFKRLPASVRARLPKHTLQSRISH